MKKAVSITAIMVLMALLSFLMVGCAGHRITIEKISPEKIIADDNFLQEDADRFMAKIARGDIVARETISDTENYVIKSWARDRECLWNIAARRYGNPQRWYEIYAINADRIGINPDLIIESETLRLPVLSIDKK